MKIKEVILVIGILFILMFSLSIGSAKLDSEKKSEKIDGEILSKIDEEVLDKFESGEKKVKVIIKLKEEGFESGELRRRKLKRFGRVAEALEIKGERYKNYVQKEISLSELNELKENNDIEEILQSHKIHAFLQDSVSLMNASLGYSLQASGMNLTGSNQTVCIIDSGVNFSHSDLMEKNKSCVIDCFNKLCVENCSIGDDNGHGTHVAGIVAASEGIMGISYNASLIGVRVLDSNGDGSGNDYDLSRAIDYCVDQNVSVITMSLGTSTLYDGDCASSMSPWTESIDSAFAKNISVVVATGNQGNFTHIASPACIGNVTAVGSVRKDDSTIDYNRNSLVKLIAPGVSINSTFAGGSCLSGCSCSGEYMICSGTSMATPMVAGAFAIIHQFLDLSGQTRTPSQIESVFNSTGKLISDASSGLDFSRIDIYSAVLSLDNVLPNVSLISPSNDHINSTQNHTFVCNATDDLQLSNVTLEIWNSQGDLYYNLTNDTRGTFAEVEFNVDMSKGNYQWNCLAYDVGGNSNYSSSNFTLYIGNISVSLTAPANDTYVNNNQTNFTCLSQTASAFDLSNVTFNLWNSTSDLIYNLTQNVSGTSNSTLFNYNFSSEENYEWNCQTDNNESMAVFADDNYTVTYDVSVPVIELTAPSNSASYSSNSQSVTFNYNVTDGSGIANCSLIVRKVINLTDSSISASLTQSFVQVFPPGSYNWKINCTDNANNQNESVQRSFSVGAPSVTSSSGGGGGGSIISLSTSKTYSPANEEVSKGYTQGLSKNDKIQFTFFDEKAEKHTLTVDEVGVDFVNITIQSEPIKLTLGIGQSAKLNLTSDNYYDIYIRLNSITGDKAELTIQTIYEEIVNLKGVSGKAVDDGVSEEEDLGAWNSEIRNLRIIIYLLVLIIVVIIILVLIKERKILAESLREGKIKEYKDKFKKDVKPKKESNK